jgi:hypothetical protein
MFGDTKHFDTLVSMLLANSHFVLTAYLEPPWEFVQDGGQVSSAPHLDPNSPTNIEGTIDLPVNAQAFEKFSQLWHDFLADRSMIDTSDVHLVLHCTK